MAISRNFLDASGRGWEGANELLLTVGRRPSELVDRVVAIDRLEMPEIGGVTFAQRNSLSDDAPDRRRCFRGG